MFFIMAQNVDVMIILSIVACIRSLTDIAVVLEPSPEPQRSRTECRVMLLKQPQLGLTPEMVNWAIRHGLLLTRAGRLVDAANRLIRIEHILNWQVLIEATEAETKRWLEIYPRMLSDCEARAYAKIVPNSEAGGTPHKAKRVARWASFKLGPLDFCKFYVKLTKGKLLNRYRRISGWVDAVYSKKSRHVVRLNKRGRKLKALLLERARSRSVKATTAGDQEQPGGIALRLNYSYFRRKRRSIGSAVRSGWTQTKANVRKMVAVLASYDATLVVEALVAESQHSGYALKELILRDDERGTKYNYSWLRTARPLAVITFCIFAALELNVMSSSKEVSLLISLIATYVLLKIIRWVNSMAITRQWRTTPPEAACKLIWGAWGLLTLCATTIWALTEANTSVSWGQIHSEIWTHSLQVRTWRALDKALIVYASIAVLVLSKEWHDLPAYLITRACYVVVTLVAYNAFLRAWAEFEFAIGWTARLGVLRDREPLGVWEVHSRAATLYEALYKCTVTEVTDQRTSTLVPCAILIWTAAMVGALLVLLTTLVNFWNHKRLPSQHDRPLRLLMVGTAAFAAICVATSIPSAIAVIEMRGLGHSPAMANALVTLDLFDVMECTHLVDEAAEHNNYEVSPPQKHQEGEVWLR